MVGATGDGAGEEGRRIGVRVEVEVLERDADADGGGGTTVQAQNDVGGSIGRRKGLVVALEAPDVSIGVPILHPRRCLPGDCDREFKRGKSWLMFFNSILILYHHFCFLIFFLNLNFIYSFILS